ncbi:PDGLE domain-containing protein [Methanobacterium alcaliphilum]|uniref:PDGLE domain-containing protein n=1 Tax=Methanobacterium alcaliphilum TaxID=392018 RepID=UPI00200A9F34|nr:PDGLE domain-containing protein [Methanobacterium alcaliphilum]MCK9152181.1 PDGLE domain-containing protein [Methanobacterium alcaliphilum]
MKDKDKKLLVGGLIIALIICILAPFLASSNPDGLESAAEKLMPNPETEPALEATLPDYTIPALGEDNPWGGVLALIVGTLLVILLAFGIASIFKKTPEEESNGEE